MDLLCHYDWPGNVRELRSTVECLAAKADGRMITTDQVRHEIDAEQEPLLTPSNAECFPRLREAKHSQIIYVGECWRFMNGSGPIWEVIRRRLTGWGMHRNTLYDWLEWARQHVAK